MSTGDINRGADFYARLFNVTERRVQQLAKEGIIPRAGRGKYPLIGTIQGYVKFLQDRAAAHSFEAAPGDIQAERIRLTRAQADAQELKNAITQKKLVPVEFAAYAVGGSAAQIASIFDTIPMTMKRRHPELEARHIDSITREVSKARNHAARLPEKLPELLDDYFRVLEASE